MKNFDKFIRESGLKKSEISEKSDISPKHISRMSSKDGNPTISTLIRMAKVIGGSILDFFSIDELKGSKYYDVFPKSGSEKILIDKSELEERDRKQAETNQKLVDLYERVETAEANFEKLKKQING